VVFQQLYKPVLAHVPILLETDSVCRPYYTIKTAAHQFQAMTDKSMDEKTLSQGVGWVTPGESAIAVRTAVPVQYICGHRRWCKEAAYGLTRPRPDGFAKIE